MTFFKNLEIFYFIIFINIHICFNYLCLSQLVAITDKGVIEYLYINKLIQNDIETLEVQQISKEKKITLCNLIFNLEYIRSPFKVFLNKNAFHILDADYENKHVIITELNENELETTQKMFPCYGRHEIMRSDWNLDDHFNLINLAILSNNEVIVFTRHKTTETDVYLFYKLFLNLNIEEMGSTYIQSTEIEQELQLLNELSYSYDDTEIEINYIREVIKKPLIPIHLEPACNLTKEKKLELCKQIFGEDLGPQIDSMLQSSMECVPNVIEFTHAKNYNSMNYKQLMYPCNELAPDNILRGKDNLPAIYFSAGYRPNSILIYAKFEETNTFTMYGFVENFKYVQEGNLQPEVTFLTGEFDQIRILQNVQDNGNILNEANDIIMHE